MQNRKVFKEGETVILYDPDKDNQLAYRLKRGTKVNLHKGLLDFDSILGKEDGTVVKTSTGGNFIAFKPTLRQFIMHMKRDTQIIYPKDIGTILLYADIYPGARVLEAGIGSGALTLGLLRAVGKDGQVISYEIREEFAKRALENIRQYLGEVENHTLKIKDVYEGIDETEIDRVILDVPEPWRTLEHVKRALRPGGIFLSYLPTIIQVKTLVDALRAEPAFCAVEVLEVLVRNWQIEGLSVRPFHRMVAHTGFLTIARRLRLPEEEETASRGEDLSVSDQTEGLKELPQ